VQASVIKALPSRISIAPKGHAVVQVSQAVHLSDRTRTLTYNSFDRMHDMGCRMHEPA
jgi:hypothetical protein